MKKLKNSSKSGRIVAPRVTCILPSAGQGTRMGYRLPKAFVKVSGLPLIVLTIRNLLKSYQFNHIIVPTPPEYMDRFGQLLKRYRLASRVTLVKGGPTRAESVKYGFDAVDDKTDVVLIHDMARPFVTKEMIRDLIDAVAKYGAALIAQPVTSTVKQIKKANHFQIYKTLDRNVIYLAQTPQGFRFGLLKKLYAKAKGKIQKFTDEAQFVESRKVPVWVVPGSALNIKVTTPQDLVLAEVIAKTT